MLQLIVCSLSETYLIKQIGAIETEATIFHWKLQTNAAHLLHGIEIITESN